MNKSMHCILCGKEAAVLSVQGKDAFGTECEICGRFFVDGILEGYFTEQLSKEDKAMLSAHTRENFESKKQPPFFEDEDEIQILINAYKNKSIRERIDNLLCYLKNKSGYFGQQISWDPEKDYPITFSLHAAEFLKIVEAAKKKDLIDWKARDAGLELTADGWDRAKELLAKP